MSTIEKTLQTKYAYNMRNAVVSYYLLVMFTFFELFLTSQYARARTDKFILFIVLTTVLIVAVAAISLAYYLDKNAPPETRVKEQKSVLSLSVTDVAFLSFFLCAVVTTLLSDYKLESLMGSAGRDNGLLLLFLYIAMYFIVSRFYYFKNYVLCALLVFGSIVSLLAVLHFFYFDPLGIMSGYSSQVIDDFGTTIGNKNTIAAYMCILLPFALMMFIMQKNQSVRILSGVAIVFSYYGLLVAGSNSGYLGLFAMLFSVMLVCIRKPDRFFRFMLSLSIMFSSGLALGFFCAISGIDSKGFEQIGTKLISGTLSYLLVILCITLTVVMYMLNRSGKLADKWPKTTLSIIVIIIGVCVLMLCSYLFYYYTVVDTKTDIGALSHFFRFDDRWGTHRGFMWINGVRDFIKSDPLYILFGSGCDTFYIVFEPHFLELSSRFGNSSTDCIHSEYLNYLITQGVLGLLSYLVLVISAIVRALKTSRKNPLVLIFVFSVIAYCAQSVVNLYTPIVTPFLFIFIALCESLSRGSYSTNKL